MLAVFWRFSEYNKMPLVYSLNLIQKNLYFWGILKKSIGGIIYWPRKNKLRILFFGYLTKLSAYLENMLNREKYITN